MASHLPTRTRYFKSPNHQSKPSIKYGVPGKMQPVRNAFGRPPVARFNESLSNYSGYISRHVGMAELRKQQIATGTIDPGLLIGGCFPPKVTISH